MKTTEFTIDKDTNQLLIAILLIGVGIPLVMRGVKQGNLLLMTGITLLQRYFDLEERLGEFAESIIGLFGPKRA